MKNEKKVKKRSALMFKPYPLSPTYRILGMLCVLSFLSIISIMKLLCAPEL